MIFLLSPAKTLDYDSELPALELSQPQFVEHSAELIEILEEFSEEEVGELMSISPKLSALNAARFREWGVRHDASSGARPCIFAFKGDVYQGLNVSSWSPQDVEKAQKSIRVLSGLYGLLRPLDLMRPYRLEMGTKLETKRGSNLYQFWGMIPTEALNEELKRLKSPVVVNLASNEYFSAVKPKELTAPVITPVFKDWKNGKYKIISFYAKKARGLMAAWAIQNDVATSEGLKEFTQSGYQFCAEESTETTLTFLRKIEE